MGQRPRVQLDISRPEITLLGLTRNRSNAATMAPGPTSTNTQWDHEYNTIRREKLFRSPPTDHTAYPALQLAVNPHIDSFNALFRDDGKPGLIDHAIVDIGIKTYFDGDDGAGPIDKNRLTIRYKGVTLHKPQLPPGNKFARNRDIYPAECRERHASYKGRLMVTFEYRINDGDPHEFTREMGLVPIMLKVRASQPRTPTC